MRLRVLSKAQGRNGSTVEARGSRRWIRTVVPIVLAGIGAASFVSLDAAGQGEDAVLLERKLAELEANVAAMKQRLHVLQQAAEPVTREGEFFVLDSNGKELRLLYRHEAYLLLQDDAGHVINYSAVNVEAGGLKPGDIGKVYYRSADCSGRSYALLSRQGEIVRLDEGGQSRVYRLPLTAEPVLVTPKSMRRVFLPYPACEQPDVPGETGATWLYPLPATWEPIDDYLLQPPLRLVRRGA